MSRNRRIQPSTICERRVALVLGSGAVGGLQKMNAALAQHLRRLDVDVTIAFVRDAGSLGSWLSSVGVPYRNLDFAHERHVLLHPRRYAVEVARVGPDGALLAMCNYLGAALRVGGYRGLIAAQEQGPPLRHALGGLSRPLQWGRRISRVSGAWADDVEIAVSDYMLDQVLRGVHAKSVVRIHNAVDPDLYHPTPARDRYSDLVVGFAGRLIAGKGADHLIRAVATANMHTPIRLMIAGEGPEYQHLTALVCTLGLRARVGFQRLVSDMPAFWRNCDVAAVPSDAFPEACPLAATEAMSSGKPVVASRNGGLPEIVLDGVTGTIVEPGDIDDLAAALTKYATNRQLLHTHGEAARSRVVQHFNIARCAHKYLDLLVRHSVPPHSAHQPSP